MIDQPPKRDLTPGEDYPEARRLGHLVCLGDDLWVSADVIESIEVSNPYTDVCQARVVVRWDGCTGEWSWKPDDERSATHLAVVRAYASDLRHAVAEAHPTTLLAMMLSDLPESIDLLRIDVSAEILRAGSR